jgi:phosphonate transport system permease protein
MRDSLPTAQTEPTNGAIAPSPAVREMLAREEKPVTPLKIVFWLLMLAILVVSFQQTEIDFLKLFSPASAQRIGSYIGEYWPPDFNYWRRDLVDTLITVAMAIWGTLLAAIISIPFGLLASSNICPVWVVQPTRRILDAARAVNEIIFALIFVVAVGLGPFSGVLALFVNTVGNLGKLFSEAVEAIDSGPVEGIRATGASKLQEIIFGIIPQVMPLWSSYTLYRFEANFRAASVLGFVGAGGIGFALYQSIRSFDNDRVSAILIILIVTTAIIDTISARIRRKLV